ncbi:MAG: FAD-dependent oxidoreductase, partial [Rhodospirillales bacterium]|nr:FAD-dependent oxidoreductase [Rhodospirillales bacterium]
TAMSWEPDLKCAAALHSPSTGILDSHAFMLSLQGEAEAAGAVFAFLTPFESGRITDQGIVIRTGGAEPMEILSSTVINSAGLSAQDVAAAIEGLSPEWVPPRHFAKGNYFTLTGRAPFARLIYPLPGPASLGTHYTRDLGGQGRFGPDVEWLNVNRVQDIDYTVDPRRADEFYAAIRRYWPGLPDGALQPGYSGVRPKIQAPGEDARDFLIQGPGEHGVPGLVNLFGIESPGLTSSLAIAEVVMERLP